jgi:hypothetical protein
LHRILGRVMRPRTCTLCRFRARQEADRESHEHVEAIERAKALLERYQRPRASPVASVELEMTRRFQAGAAIHGQKFSPALKLAEGQVPESFNLWVSENSSNLSVAVNSTAEELLASDINGYIRYLLRFEDDPSHHDEFLEAMQDVLDEQSTNFEFEPVDPEGGLLTFGDFRERTLGYGPLDDALTKYLHYLTTEGNDAHLQHFMLARDRRVHRIRRELNFLTGAEEDNGFEDSENPILTFKEWMALPHDRAIQPQGSVEDELQNDLNRYEYEYLVFQNNISALYNFRAYRTFNQEADLQRFDFTPTNLPPGQEALSFAQWSRHPEQLDQGRSQSQAIEGYAMYLRWLDVYDQAIAFRDVRRDWIRAIRQIFEDFPHQILQTFEGYPYPQRPEVDANAETQNQQAEQSDHLPSDEPSADPEPVSSVLSEEELVVEPPVEPSTTPNEVYETATRLRGLIIANAQPTAVESNWIILRSALTSAGHFINNLQHSNSTPSRGQQLAIDQLVEVMGYVVGGPLGRHLIDLPGLSFTEPAPFATIPLAMRSPAQQELHIQVTNQEHDLPSGPPSSSFFYQIEQTQTNFESGHDDIWRQGSISLSYMAAQYPELTLSPNPSETLLRQSLPEDPETLHDQFAREDRERLDRNRRRAQRRQPGPFHGAFRPRSPNPELDNEEGLSEADPSEWRAMVMDWAETVQRPVTSASSSSDATGATWHEVFDMQYDFDMQSENSIDARSMSDFDTMSGDEDEDEEEYDPALGY